MTPSDTSRRLRCIISGSIGNLVEWYDWYTYSVFSLYFASQFFPSSNYTVSLMYSAAVFALGFLIRPPGAWLMGVIADRKGRRFAMTCSVVLMSLGSLLIACVPTYDKIGIFAPIILLLARLIQGLSVGGEYGTSATYLSEMATPNRRGFYSSFQYVTLVGGQIMALVILVMFQYWFFTKEEITQWAWRLPFVFGAILGLLGYVLRSTMEESDKFKEQKNKEVSSLATLCQHPKASLWVIGMTAGGTVAFYTYTSYMQIYLVNTLKVSKETSALLSLYSLALFALIQPLFGLLSDVIGRKPLLISFGILGTFGTIPLIQALSQASSHTEMFFWLLLALIVVSGYTSINAIVKAELFPTSIRALGVGLPYALAVSMFGGSAEFIALKFKEVGYEVGYYWYVSGLIGISLIIYIFIPETKRESKIDMD